jgi:hypothetical protein
MQESMQKTANNSRSGKKKTAVTKSTPELFSQTTVSSGCPSDHNASLATMGSYHEFAVCIFKF